MAIVAKKNRPAKTGKRSAPDKLPACVAFLLCEKVLPGIDGSVSIIRMIDTIGVPNDPNRKKLDFVELPEIQLFLAIKRIGTVPMVLELSSVDPHDKRTRLGRLEYAPEKTPEGGTVTSSPVRFRWGGEGIYWLELSTTDGRSVGRTPFRVVSGTQEEVQEKIRKAKSNGSL
jgi:hypothetical protein